MPDEKYQYGSYGGADATFTAHDDEDDFPVNPDWLRLTSVGIDIGSSTSHLMFSRLVMRRRGKDMSGEFEVVHRKVLYRSPILLTPYSDPDTIDTDALSEFVEQSYRHSSIEPHQVDTGAVICTGEAVRKHNSEAIIRMLAERGGAFVCATAGPNLEAILGAHGSGAVQRSRNAGTLMNVDIGGGTAKLALVENGVVTQTMAINVGARLLAWDQDNRITRIEAAGRRMAEACGADLHTGDLIGEDMKQAIASGLADILFEAIAGEGLSELAQALLITSPFSHAGTCKEISFSGGVSEYVYGLDSRDYGDLGPWLGKAIHQRLKSFPIPVAGSLEHIRATVIGASQYTIQVSSSTVYISNDSILPMLDLQVVPVHLPAASPDLSMTAVTEAIQHGFERLDLVPEDLSRPVALALIGPVFPSRSSIRALVDGLSIVMSRIKGHPWVLIFSADIAGLIGAMLKEEDHLPADLVVVDGIRVGEFNFVDLGKMISTHEAIPVVVKSLVFEG